MSKKAEVGNVSKYIIVTVVITCALLLGSLFIVDLSASADPTKFDVGVLQAQLNNLTMFQKKMQNSTSQIVPIPGYIVDFNPTNIIATIQDLPTLFNIFTNLAVMGLSGGDPNVATVISILFNLGGLIVIIGTVGYIISKIPI